jgi:hypothetical protein
MAVVGDAFIVVRAITTGVEKDIKNAFNGTDRIGESAGNNVGKSFVKGFMRGGDGRSMFGPLISQSTAARERFTSLTRAGYALAPALTALGGIIGVLGTSLLSLGSIISAATLPALAVLGQSLTAVAQAAITLKLAFSGVGKAISAGTKAKKSGVKESKALENAEKRLEKALRAQGEAAEDAAEREKDAKESLTDAEDALHKAREQAIQDLEQLGFESEDAAIAEQRAAIELEKARETLARVSDLPPNSRARKEAELAFAQADLNYRKAIDANNDLKKTEAKNAELAKKGPEALIDGQENVVSALKAQKNAQEDLADVQKNNTRSLIAAKEAVDEAAEAVEELKNGGGAADAYADALAGLSKEARAFVEYMVNVFIPALKDLKAAAGAELFPKLETALENLRLKLFPALIPLLKETGGVIGDIAIKFSEAITKGENLERLERIWKSNNTVLTNFGDAAINLYESFLILLDTARPLTEEFSKWVATLTGGWTETLKADEASGKLNEKFEIARGILKDLGKIFGNVFGGLGKIISANVGPGSGGQIFLDYLKEVTGRFKNITEIDGRPLKDFFADAAENGTKLLDLLGNIFGGFIGMADNAGLGIFLGQLNQVVDIFQRVGENLDASLPSFGNFLIEFATFVALVTESGSITVFFDTLSKVLGKINEFLATDLGQKILNISAQILPLLAAFGLIASIAKFAFLVVIGGIVKLITPFITLATVIFKAYKAWQGLQIVMLLGTGPVLAIIAVIAALVAIVVLLFVKSEKLREAFMLLVDGALGALKGAFNDVMGAIDSIMPSIRSVGELFESVGNFLAVTLVPILSFILVRAIGVLSGAIQKVIYVIGGIIEAFKAVWYFVKGIFQLLTGNTEGAADSMKKSFSAAFSAIKNVIKSIVSPFVGVLNAISDAWNNTVGKFDFKVPSWVPIIGGKTFNVPNLPRINLANFAEGGTVFPQTGGVIARVAEAGRPERIEPLDPEGLSVRDRAIIDRLSGGGGKGVVVNVYPSEGMDEKELAAIVSRQIAFATRRGAA